VIVEDCFGFEGIEAATASVAGIVLTVDVFSAIANVLVEFSLA